MRTLLASASSSIQSGLSAAGGAAGYASNLPLTTIVANVIKVVLGLTGIVFVCFLVYAGFLYLTAGGVDDNVKKAKKLIANSVIGILIIVSAYAIASYLFAALNTITTATG